MWFEVQGALLVESSGVQGFEVKRVMGLPESPKHLGINSPNHPRRAFGEGFF